MKLDDDLHVTNYVMRHFRHLMSEVERAAADALVLPDLDASRGLARVIFREGVKGELADQALAALKDGVEAFRRRTRERIVLQHKAEVYANACPQCGRLPTSTRVRVCIWCSHSWGEGSPAAPLG